MTDLTCVTPTVPLRIIRPLAEETEEHFCQRMRAMMAVLNRYAPGLTTTFIAEHAGTVACAVIPLAPLNPGAPRP